MTKTLTAALAALTYALARSKRRLRAVLLLLAGGAIAAGVTALLVLSQLRYPS